MLWDTSADDLVLAGAAGIDLAGDIDVDGTANLDAVDIDGAVQIDNTVTVGENDTGYDVKFFGATSGAYMLWDESTDDLILAGASKLYLYDAGGEYLSSSGSALTIASGGVAWELPAADGSADQYLKTDGSGNLDWASAGSAAVDSYTNSTDNRVITSVDSSTINAEANLTFDGTTLAVTGTVEPSGDTASGDNAAIGYTAAEGLILTGQGSTNDVTIKNDADGDVISIPTGTQHVIVEGRQLGIAYNTPATFGLNVTGIVVGDGTGNAGISLYSNGYGHVAFSDSDATEASRHEGLIQYNHASERFQLVAGGNYVAYLYSSGAFTITGALSKGSGSFRIDHPLPEKKDTHQLVHSFIEGPQADLIYRGKIDLVNGTATVNIDTVSGMSEGTFVLLNREIQCFTSNETGWTAVKGSVSGNSLTITAQDETCTDTISWMVVGERQDQHMYDTEWTDENGKPIIEPLKETE